MPLFSIDVFHHIVTPVPPTPGDEFARILRKIDTMSAQLDALTTQVAETNTVIASAVTLIGGLSTEIAAIRAELAATGVTNDRLDELSTSLDGSEQALAAAVAANTPAAPEPTPV